METLLARVLRHYNLGALRHAERVQGGFVNDNWILRTARGKYFLKHRHPSLRKPDIIRAQHALMGYIRRADFPAPAVIPAASGDTLVVSDGEFFEVQEYIEGHPYEPSNPAHFHAAAATLGRYHACVHGFAPKALRAQGDLFCSGNVERNLAIARAAWTLAENSRLARDFRALEPHVRSLASRFATHGELPRLVTHGDYYAGNLLFSRNRIVAVVDYDKASFQPRVAELAEALIYFTSEPQEEGMHLVYPGVLAWDKLTRFLRSYAAGFDVGLALRRSMSGRQEPRRLEGCELDALPDYVLCIWLCVSLQCLREQAPRAVSAAEALADLRILCEWSADNRRRMVETTTNVTQEPPPPCPLQGIDDGESNA